MGICFHPGSLWKPFWVSMFRDSQEGGVVPWSQWNSLQFPNSAGLCLSAVFSFSWSQNPGAMVTWENVALEPHELPFCKRFGYPNKAGQHQRKQIYWVATLQVSSEVLICQLPPRISEGRSKCSEFPPAFDLFSPGSLPHPIAESTSGTQVGKRQNQEGWSHLTESKVPKLPTKS